MTDFLTFATLLAIALVTIVSIIWIWSPDFWKEHGWKFVLTGCVITSGLFMASSVSAIRDRSKLTPTNLPPVQAGNDHYHQEARPAPQPPSLPRVAPSTQDNPFNQFPRENQYPSRQPEGNHIIDATPPPRYGTPTPADPPPTGTKVIVR